MKKIGFLVLSLLWALPSVAQIPGPAGVVIDQTPVQGGTSPNCLYITSTKRVGQQACGTGTAANIQVGTTTVRSGTTPNLLYNNAGVLGNTTSVSPYSVTATGTVAARTLADRFAYYLQVEDFGAIGNGSTSDQTAFSNAVTAACALGGVPLFLGPNKIYRLTATLTIPCSNLVFVGAGKYVTTVYRDFTTGPTLRFGKPDRTIISAVGVEGVSFGWNTALTLDSSDVAHIEVEAGSNVSLKSLLMYNLVEGIHLIGGNEMAIEDTVLTGNYATYASRFALRATYNPNLSSGTSRQPTTVKIVRAWWSGPTVNGSGQGSFLNTLYINAGEAWNVADSYFGQGQNYNILIEQGADNAFIGDMTFTGNYIDAADRGGSAGDGVFITGSTGNGSQAIQNISFIGGTIKGQSGDGRDGVRVDGTNRGAVTYPQAVVGLKIVGVTVAAWYRHGINLEGGRGTVVTGNSIKGNNYTNAGSGVGLIVGATSSNTIVTGNRIGGDAFDGATSDFQVYGIEVKLGAASYSASSNDLTLNATGYLLSSTDGTWALNRTGSGALLINGTIGFEAPVKLGAANTVGTLPTTAAAGAVAGARAYVTDQLRACVATGGALTGGGAVTCPVFYNGAAWVGG